MIEPDDDDECERGPATPENTRKEGATGLPITLENGRAWHFASPGLRRRPKVVKAIVAIGGRDEVATTIVNEPVWGLSPELRRLLGKVTEACDSDPSGDCPAGLIYELAFASLRTCHDLTPDETCEILEMSDASFQAFAPHLVFAAWGQVTPASSPATVSPVESLS